MESMQEILKEQPFFKDFASQHLKKIADRASQVKFTPGKYIFKSGEEANQFFLIQKGLVSLELYAPKRGPVSIGTIGAGDVLGWSWLYPPHRWHFDAKVGEETSAISIDGHFLRETIESDHDLGFLLMKRIAQIVESRLQATRMKLLEVYEIYPEPDHTRPKWQNLLTE